MKVEEIIETPFFKVLVVATTIQQMIDLIQRGLILSGPIEGKDEEFQRAEALLKEATDKMAQSVKILKAINEEELVKQKKEKANEQDPT